MEGCWENMNTHPSSTTTASVQTWKDMSLTGLLEAIPSRHNFMTFIQKRNKAHLMVISIVCASYLLFVYAQVLQASSSADSCSILSGTHTSLRFNSWLMHGGNTAFDLRQQWAISINLVNVVLYVCFSTGGSSPPGCALKPFNAHTYPLIDWLIDLLHNLPVIR